MTDFEMFSKHWNNAIYGLVGQIRRSDSLVLTRRRINELWREELLNNRFSAVGISSEAKAFMTELYDRRPETARQVSDMLSESRLDAGLEGWGCAMKAAGALITAGVAVGATKKTGANMLVKGAAGAASVALTGLTGAEMLAASKDPLAQAIVEEARRQLEAYRPLLERADGAGEA